MSKSTLRVKYYEIFKTTSLEAYIDKNFLEEDIVDIVYEPTDDAKHILTFIILLSRGTIAYIEYDITLKQIMKV